ncbi:MAG: MerR family transcriptional regulator [Candidatus Omnitrophica bacterium]|nr:MerR family transcriptional regulator [Candidatus Omnitrophota bacterium]
MIHEIKRKYTVQDVADMIGVYRGTVINYEKKGIFPESSRNPINGYREYTEEDVEMLQNILAGEVAKEVSI